MISRHLILFQNILKCGINDKSAWHMADLSLCYPLMWNVTLEYTTLLLISMSWVRPDWETFPDLPHTLVSKRSTL